MHVRGVTLERGILLQRRDAEDETVQRSRCSSHHHVQAFERNYTRSRARSIMLCVMIVLNRSRSRHHARQQYNEKHGGRSLAVMTVRAVFRVAQRPEAFRLPSRSTRSADQAMNLDVVSHYDTASSLQAVAQKERSRSRGRSRLCLKPQRTRLHLLIDIPARNCHIRQGSHVWLMRAA